MKKLNLALVLFLSLFLMQSCQKDELTTPDPQGQKAPALPTAESFIMPYNAFEEFSGEDDSRTTSNWLYSASHVLVWNTILTVHLAVPVLAFYESFNHDAVYQGAGVWLWAYDINNSGSTYHAKLYGELLSTNEVKWEMHISQEGGFSEVMWYSGITAIGGAYANWTLNYNGYNPTPIINIDYQKNNGSDVESIQYTNIIPGAPENGSYIEYRISTGQGVEFNRAYDIYKSEIDNLMEINWNNPGNNGRVKDAEHFQDSEWHCWDYSLQDINC
jgi:hypothetical protein